MVPPRRFVTAQLVIGIVVLALGAIFLLDNLGYPIGRQALKYWPAVLVVIGGAKILQARNMPGAMGGSALVLAGVWLLGTRLGLIDWSLGRAIRTFWPLILVGLGVSIVWGALTRRGRNGGGTLESRDTIHAVAVLGGVKRVNASANFKGGDAYAYLGGVILDLRPAKLTGEAVFHVFAMWGGIELQVPETWSVDLQITPLLGGTDDKTRPVTDPNAPRLIVRGTVLMGGVEIKN